MKSFLLMIGFVLTSFLAQAQEVEMADQFRQDGKIYVVIAVVAVILSGIFIYLFRLDAKISKLEKQLKK
ncbi:CcmD family protein [Aquirufa sp. ROCK2-A2]